MATPAQMEANRQNALLSTGPKTAEGKVASRRNAVKDGLTGDGVVLPDDDQAKIEGRVIGFSGVFLPVTQVETFLVETLATDSVRIERCRQEELAIRTAIVARASESWESDRSAEAASFALKLSKGPEYVSRHLITSLEGATWLRDRWQGLLSSLEAGSDWTDDEVTHALDLLGVPSVFRDGKFSKLDPPKGDESTVRDFRKRLATEQVADLSERIEGPLATLDDFDREHAMNDLVLIDNPKLARLRRYEAALMRRYDKNRAQLSFEKTQRPPKPAPAPLPPRKPLTMLESLAMIAAQVESNALANRSKEPNPKPSPSASPGSDLTSEVMPTPVVASESNAILNTTARINLATAVTPPTIPQAAVTIIESPAPTPAPPVDARRGRPDLAHLKDANRRHRLALKSESRQTRNAETKPISV